MNVAVVTCYFNLAGFSRPKENLFRFLRDMKRDGAPVYGVEAHLSTVKAETYGMTNWKQIRLRPDQMLWQKEALLCLAEEQVPAQYDAIAWVDADVWFEAADWRERTHQALEKHDVVQMFDTCGWLDHEGRVVQTRPAAAVLGLNNKWKSHPGFAWAMRRELWQKSGGIYPYAISGGGDTIMTLAFLGTKLWPEAEETCGTDPGLYYQWAETFKGIKTGFVPGKLLHSYHGTLQNRGYVTRKKLVKGVNHAKDLHLATNGLVTWHESVPQDLRKAVTDYFKSRQEDNE